MERKGVNRGGFIRMSAIGLVGGYTALRSSDAWARGMTGGGGGSTTTIADPAPGAPFADPPVLLNESAQELLPEFHTVHLLVAEVYHAVGKSREAAQAYGRYLAAEPLPCDRERVLQRLGVIVEAR